jgi:transcription antitermination factor nusB
MGRHEQREQVFILLFQAEFHKPEEMPRQMRLYLDGNEEIGSQKTADKIEERCQKICGKIPELDKLIDANTEGWDTTRMGKVELTVLRLAAYEIRYDEEVPDSVAINEAVEIAKKFGQDTSGAFVNAILGKIVKQGE